MRCYELSKRFFSVVLLTSVFRYYADLIFRTQIIRVLVGRNLNREEEATSLYTKTLLGMVRCPNKQLRAHFAA